MKNNQNRFERCLLVVNPSGSSYRRGLKLRGSLEHAFQDKPFVIVRLSQSELTQPKQLRRELKKLNKNSLLAIIGGDGTVNFVINEMLTLPDTTPQKATILPLWGGNACDLAHMANGRRRNSVLQILRHGEQVAVHPMQYHLTQNDATNRGYAMCYVSFGAVAFTANELDKSRLVRKAASFPPLRLLAEASVGLVGLTKSKRFSTLAGEKLYDLLLINGPRIAKLYRTPARLDSPDFVELKISHKYPVLITHFSKLTRVWMHGVTVKQRKLTVLEPTWMQFDGEIRRLESKTAVLVKPARQSITLLATK